jgi:hypothetical protein
MKLRIIGDVHGKIESYLKVALDAEGLGYYTVQLGDLSLSPRHYKRVEEELDPTRHFVILGNRTKFHSA